MNNSRSYWELPGYLHRYYLLEDPMIKQGASFAKSGALEQLQGKISSFREREDVALKDFHSIFTVEGETPSAEGGLKKLNQLALDSQQVYDEMFAKIMKDFKSGKKGRAISDSVMKQTRNIIRNATKNSLSDASSQDINKISRELSKEIKENFQSMASPKPAIALGNWWERYFTSLLNVEISSAITNHGSDISNFIQKTAVGTSREILDKKSIVGNTKFFGKTPLNSMKPSDDMTDYGQKQSSYDILVKVEGKNPLPIQMKARTVKNKEMGALNNVSVGLLLNTAIGKAQADYLKFALIHQHMFSDPSYISLVSQIQIDNGEASYTTGSDGSAIEFLNKSGVIPDLAPAIEIFRQSVASKAIAGLMENQESLIYIVEGISDKKGKTNGAIMRVSDMLQKVIGRGHTNSVIVSNVDKWSVPSSVYDDFGSAGHGLSREEWYDSVSSDMLHAIDKISVSLKFNYANVDKI